MATSVVHAAVLTSALATLPALGTRLVAFDTAVVDLTEQLADPVELLFGVQLGGGTDIEQAVGYCEGLVTKPRDTLLVLITDLFEGGDALRLLHRVAGLVERGAHVGEVVGVCQHPELALLGLDVLGSGFERKLH